MKIKLQSNQVFMNAIYLFIPFKKVSFVEQIQQGLFLQIKQVFLVLFIIQCNNKIRDI